MKNNIKSNIRLNRSELAVPGIRKDFFEKAAKCKSDIVFLDLEDSVSVGDKIKARQNIIQAINEIDWKNKILSVRVNSFETSFLEKDIEDIIKNTSDNLDLLMIPKVNSSNDIKKIDQLITEYELKYKKKNQLGLELIIETALGLINIEKIALSSKRIESLHFGAADFSASIGAKTTNIGGVNENYRIIESKNKINRNFFINDMWHYPLSRIVITAHAFGLRAVDCPYGDFNDELGFETMAKSSYTMGFDGKMVIHPNQIETANKIYSPTEEEVNESKKILLQMEKAENQGKGAIAFNGKLLDIVSIKQANNIVELANKIKKEKKKK